MQYNKLTIGIILVAIIAIIIGLITSNRAEHYDKVGYTEPSMGFVEDMAFADGEFDARSVSSYYEESFDTAGQTAADIDQRIIKTGDMQLRVDAITKAIDAISDIAAQHEGFVQSSNEYENPDGSRYGWITIRIPSEQFEASLTQIKEHAVVVQSESVDARDVTERYTDLEARLRNTQAEEEAYLSLLNRAGSVSDLLEVQRELSRVRGNIESLQGQIQYLENQTSLSTITVHLEEERMITISSKRFRIAPIFTEAVQSVILVARWIVTAVVWIVVLGIGIGIPLAILYWIARQIIKRTHKH